MAKIQITRQILKIDVEVGHQELSQINQILANELTRILGYNPIHRTPTLSFNTKNLEGSHELFSFLCAEAEKICYGDSGEGKENMYLFLCSIFLTPSQTRVGIGIAEVMKPSEQVEQPESNKHGR